MAAVSSNAACAPVTSHTKGKSYEIKRKLYLYAFKIIDSTNSSKIKINNHIRNAN